MDNLKIVHWNSNGITNKMNKLHALTTKINIDTILFNETRLQPSSKLTLSNKIIYRNDF